MRAEVVPSVAHQQWSSVRLAELDEIESSHAAVGGTLPGRRFATQQINHAYAMLICSQFQGFCRDLHDECIEHVVRAIQPMSLRTTMKQLMEQNRQLDRGNPNPANLGSDFNRFGLSFWPSVQSKSKIAHRWQSRLIVLTDWRNAIAHQDFDDARSRHGILSLTLPIVRQWRRACERLAETFDGVMRDHLRDVIGPPPW